MKIMTDKRYEQLAYEVRQTNDYKAARVISDFTERAWNRMHEMGLNQSELARRLGVGRSRIAKMLDGSTNFTFTTAVKLSTVLNMDFEAVLVEKGDARSNSTSVSVGYVEGVLKAKMNSSWREAKFSPVHNKTTNQDTRNSHDHSTVAAS